MKYNNMAALDYYYANRAGESGSSLYETVKNKLREFGYNSDLQKLPSFLKEKPEFLSHCQTIQAGIDEYKSIMLLVDDPILLWDIHNFFPPLYALHNLGESIYRTTIKVLLDEILDREVSQQLPKRMNNNFVLISNMFAGDNRLASLSASLEGLIDPLIFSRKIVFTSHTVKANPDDITNDVMYKLRTFYSPEMEHIFEQKVAPIIIQTQESRKSLWRKNTV